MQDHYAAGHHFRAKNNCSMRQALLWRSKDNHLCDDDDDEEEEEEDDDDDHHRRF